MLTSVCLSDCDFTKTSFEELCANCKTDVEEMAMQSIQNFGDSSFYYCGVCGRKLSKEALIAHLDLNPNGECLDASS